MNRRLEKMNKHLQRTVGEVLHAQADLPPGVLVTVSRVDTAPNLQSAKVWLSVYPLEASQDILERLKVQMYDIQGAVNRLLDLKPLPRLLLRIDYGAEHADHIQHIVAKLAEERPEQSTQGASDDRE